MMFQLSFQNNQWLFLAPLKGGRWHIILQLAVYTTYNIPLIYTSWWFQPNPSEKYARQIGNLLPKLGMKIKHI